MDLDSEVKKIRDFMSDMHALFPGGKEGLKAAAVAARAGEPMRVVGDMQPSSGAPGEIERFVELGSRLEALLPEIETLAGSVGDVIGRLSALEDAVTKLEQASPATEQASGGVDEQTGSKDPAANSTASKPS